VVIIEPEHFLKILGMGGGENVAHRRQHILPGLYRMRVTLKAERPNGFVDKEFGLLGFDLGAVVGDDRKGRADILVRCGSFQRYSAGVTGQKPLFPVRTDEALDYCRLGLAAADLFGGIAQDSTRILFGPARTLFQASGRTSAAILRLCL